MLEIIVLIFLCKKIGELAIQKGQNPRKWKWFTVINWIVFQILGFIIGVNLFGVDMSNVFGLMAFAIMSAFGGYLMVRRNLERLPDVENQS